MYVLTKQGERKTVVALPYNCNVNELFKSVGKWLSCREKYGKREHWFSEPLFIDTETSHIGEEKAWVHQWAVCWGGVAIIGRTAQELINLLMNINAACKAKGKNYKVLAYIHNLSYDMEYLRQFFPEHEPEFFAVKPHRILTAKYENIEIRCSYLLTQKPLEKWGKDSAVTYNKLVGGYDYDRVITPDMPLSETDWAYQLNDVYTMWDSWTQDRKHDKYDVRNVPLTSTGFVRNDCRKAAFDTPHWREKLDSMQPDIELYTILEDCFMGGYTHGNRFYKDRTVSAKIGHRDFCSSYPARQVVNAFPMGKFVKCSIQTKDEIYTLMPSNCELLHLYFKNVRLRDRTITAPYISLSKVNPIGVINELCDNGRVLKIDGIVHFWCTEYDFAIIDQQYTADEWAIIESYTAPKGALPAWIRGKIMEYFVNKNTLKHTDPTNYMRSKAMLNGIYGMTCERNVRPELIYDNGEWHERQLSFDERETALAKHLKKKNTFLFFAWGVWTTALARYELFNCIINGCGYEKYLYCDTDSIFYIMDDETENNFSDYNNMWNDRAVNKGACVEYNGKRSILGEFTMEDDAPLSKFRFIHAKCYATVDRMGKLSVTVAGVTKTQRRNKTKTNVDELKSIDNLTPGFRFCECGGTRIKYNNEPLHTEKINGCKIEIGASAVILPTDYVISDNDRMDEDDRLIIEMLNPHFISDTYENFVDIK